MYFSAPPSVVSIHYQGTVLVPSLEDVAIPVELAIRVALIACLLDLTAITSFCAGKKGLVAGSGVKAVHESFGRTINESRGMGFEVDVASLVFIQSDELNLAE